jgi:hypothetical protein
LRLNIEQHNYYLKRGKAVPIIFVDQSESLDEHFVRKLEAQVKKSGYLGVANLSKSMDALCIKHDFDFYLFDSSEDSEIFSSLNAEEQLLVNNYLFVQSHFESDTENVWFAVLDEKSMSEKSSQATAICFDDDIDSDSTKESIYKIEYTENLIKLHINITNLSVEQILAYVSHALFKFPHMNGNPLTQFQEKQTNTALFDEQAMLKAKC